MKTIHLFSKIVLVGILFFTSCGKDNVRPIDKDNFYRLEAYEVGVEPNNREVQILFQVTDYYHKGVANLTVDDFIVRENGGRIDSEASLKIDQGRIPYSLRTVLLLDITKSVEGLIDQIKTAAISLVDQKMNEQEMAIYLFDKDTYLLKDFTTNKNELINAINTIPETNLVNSTNLYGAIIDVADLWEDEYSIENIVDGSLVIFTDGRHNATPAITLSDAKSALGNKKVYVAALSSSDLDESALKSLAGTSDRYNKAEDISAVENMFLNIQTEIENLSGSIYYMYYQSPITDPSPYENELIVEIDGNTNRDGDSQIVEKFNSSGFGN